MDIDCPTRIKFWYMATSFVQSFIHVSEALYNWALEEMSI